MPSASEEFVTDFLIGSYGKKSVGISLALRTE